MLLVLHSTWTLFLGVALIMLGNGLQGTLLGVRASLEGFGTATTGVVMTGYYIGFLGGSILIPRLVGRVGHIRVFAALASLASASVLLHTVFVVPWLWTLMRLVTGFSYAGLYVVVESWINDRASNETRGLLLSLYMVVSLGCMMLGQLLLNLAPPQAYELFILTSVLVSMALVPISLAEVSAPPLARTPPIGLGTLYRGSPLAVVGVFGTGIANGALLGMGAVFATTAGLPVKQVAYFMMAAILGGMLLQLPVGYLSDRFDRRQVMTVASLLAAVCALAALPFVESAGLALFVLIALFGGLHMPLYALCMAHANDYLEPAQMVAAGGKMMLIFGAGSSVGPLTASLMMSAFGPGGFFWWLALIHAAIGLFALYRMTRRAARPVEEQGSFVVLAPRASPVSAGWVVEETSRHPQDGTTQGGPARR
ncbi:MAG: MFS transporter [Candidatus Competibacterales bacterium]|nr:MFS transporter [Candidatus Competibacterales bacterium]